ncbi:MAG: SLC13 family permease [Bacteroidaceae bacterium]|nr:SLC13 family permease [Bacteroidaceae bacterium]
MIATIIVLSLTIILFVSGKVRADVVALGALIIMMLLGVLTPTEALEGFSNPVIVMMVGLFVVGGAILQTGLAKVVSQRIVSLAGGNDTLLFLLVVLVTAGIGAFVSNTGTVALMMPIVVSLATQNRRNASQLLMPLAFASSMGGMLTLIGTPPNLVIHETLREYGHNGLKFFSLFPYGLICIAVGVLVMLPLSNLFLKKKQKNSGKSNTKSLDQLAQEYNLANNMRACLVTKDSNIVGQTVAGLNLRANYGITILEIRHDSKKHGGIFHNVSQFLPTPQRLFAVGDILYLQGHSEQLAQFIKLSGVEEQKSADIEFYDLGMAEMVVMPESKLVSQTIRDLRFRETYNINIIGIKRKGEYISDNLPDTRLYAGDVLLVQGKWENLNIIDNEEDEWVVLGQPKEMSERVTLDYKSPLAAIIMLLMIVTMMFDFIPVAPVTAVMAAALLMVICGCFRSISVAYKTINWESIMLIAAMMPMATALEKTGISSMISHSLVETLGTISPLMLLAGIYFTTSILTMFISNTATAVLMAPIAYSAASETGINPYPMLFAVTFGASMCFASPFSTPPNALVMHAGNYTFSDYVKVGLPLQLIMGVVMVVVLSFSL